MVSGGGYGQLGYCDNAAGCRSEAEMATEEDGGCGGGEGREDNLGFNIGCSGEEWNIVTLARTNSH